jgi:fructose-1,6-bisphosphatase II / sedoheptulose-1,7-bisphosphatase
MAIDKNFIDQFIKVTSKAALSSSYLVGKNDKVAADKAAVDSMRSELNKMNIQGKIVIGEGELDEAPMLYIGEKVGNKNGPELDIAVDPLEGTNFAANNLPGALSVIAISEKNNLLNAPETYMEKISTRVTEKNVIDLDYSVKKNISNLSDYLNKNPENITACILDRPRHVKIIDELKRMKVKLKLISDGDVSGALLVTENRHNVDIFLGIGGGPEGVLAASALDTFGCSFQGRFLFETDEDKSRAKKMGINDLKKKYELNEIVSGDSIFCATGITSGDLVSGIEIQDNEFISETLVTHKSSGLKKVIKLKQNI